MNKYFKLIINFVFLLSSPSLFAGTIVEGCPIESFSYGYNYLMGNPADATSLDDPGWSRSPIFELQRKEECLYCVAAESCAGEYNVYEMNSELEYYYSLYQKAEVSGVSDSFLSSAAFTGSEEYYYQQHNVFGLGRVNVQAEGACQLFTAWRDPNCSEVEFDTGFANAIAAFPTSTQDPNWFAQVQDFFYYFGTHFMLTGHLGARWIYESQFTQVDYDAMYASNIDVTAAAELSAEFYRTNELSGEYESEEETVMRQTYDSLIDINRIIVIGSRPPEDVSFGEWANNIENPIPQEYELAPISQLLTSSFFPNDPNIQAKRAVMETAYLIYCSYIDNCHEPKPPKIVHIKETETGKYPTKNMIAATCPEDYLLIAGGCQSEMLDEPMNWNLPSFKPLLSEQSYYCMANVDIAALSPYYTGLTATATCLHKDYVEEVVVKDCEGLTGYATDQCMVTCEPGYELTGGGCESDSVDLNSPWKVTASNPVYIDMDKQQRAWSCRASEVEGTRTNNQKVYGYALCTRFAPETIEDINIKTDYSGVNETYTNGDIVTCDTGYQILTGGCAVPAMSRPSEEWKVIKSQPASSIAWSCLGQMDLGTRTHFQDVQTDALCIKFNK